MNENETPQIVIIEPERERESYNERPSRIYVRTYRPPNRWVAALIGVAVLFLLLVVISTALYIAFWVSLALIAVALVYRAFLLGARQIPVPSMTGTLYLVPTPIGNLEDITLRALRVLREVTLIAAEDTRTSRVLLNHYEITTPLTSYHEHNKLGKLESMLDALALGDVALISDAGTPGISDPGYELVQAAIQRGVRVEPLPGANAVITALVASGLPTDSFVYLGFLPRKGLTTYLTSLTTEHRTMIAYESPNRLVEALAAVQAVLGAERPVCVARELTKKFEEFQRGTAAQVLAHFTANPPRGEITLLIGGAVVDDAPWTEDRVRAALLTRLANGESRSAASKAVAAESGWKKSDVYALEVEE